MFLGFIFSFKISQQNYFDQINSFKMRLLGASSVSKASGFKSGLGGG